YCCLCFSASSALRNLHYFPTRRSSDLVAQRCCRLSKPSGKRSDGMNTFPALFTEAWKSLRFHARRSILTMLGIAWGIATVVLLRSEEHTSELQSRENLVCRLLLEKKNA